MKRWASAFRSAVGVDGLWFAAVAGGEGAAGRTGEHERVRLAVAPGPFGEDVGDDASVVLGRELRVRAGRPGDVDAVHPDLAGEAHVEQVPQRLPADADTEPGADGQQRQRADRRGHPAASRQRSRGVPLPEIGQLGSCPLRAAAELGFVQAVHPVLTADFGGERAAGAHLAQELEGARLGLRRGGEVDGDVAHRPAGAVRVGPPLRIGQGSQLAE
jgi:hypothetical protein